MLCISRQSLVYWLENEGGGIRLVEPPVEDLLGCRLFKRMSRHLSSMANHMKSQLQGQHLVSLHRWIKTCLFRVNGSSFRPGDLTAVLDRLAIGAKVSLRLVILGKMSSRMHRREERLRASKVYLYSVLGLLQPDIQTLPLYIHGRDR